MVADTRASELRARHATAVCSGDSPPLATSPGAVAPRRIDRFTASWRRRNRGTRTALFAMLAFGLLTLASLAVTGYHVYFDRTALPDIQSLIRFELPTTGHVYDRKGNVLIAVAHQYRQVVAFDQIPVILRQSILAAEDKNFFSHAGVDYRALPRVAQKTAARSLSAWWNGEGFRLRLAQGGSTITQQLVRGFFLAGRTSGEGGDVPFRRGVGPWLLATVVGVPTANKLLRKMEEVRLALWVEREMRRRYGSRERAKEEIFSRYASYLYLGNGRYGFAAASQFYFDKPLASYTSADADKAALLAAIGKSPREYAPVEGGAAPLRRRNEILVLMAKNGFLSADLAQRSQAEPVRVAPVPLIKTDAPAAIGTVFAEVRRIGQNRFGLDDLFQGRISIQTTVDGDVQRIVNDALERGLASYERRHPSARGQIQGAVVVLRNSDAGILAEAGGREVYQDRRSSYPDFNRATGALRQPGSAWKPLVYLAAFRQGVQLDTPVPDEPIRVPGGQEGTTKWIANYDGRFKGQIPARLALAESRNTVAVWLAVTVGIDRVIAAARELGIRSPVGRGLSTALGASEVRLLELAGAYRAMASGITAAPHAVVSVTDADGARLYEAAGPVSYLNTDGLREIQEGLRGVIRLPGGTAGALDRQDFGIPVMGKTGTTSEYRDALFVGSTYGPDGITVAVWIGFDDNRTLGARETGGRTALPVFRDILLGVYRAGLVGPVPAFPWDIEQGIDGYLADRVSDSRPAERVGTR